MKDYLKSKASAIVLGGSALLAVLAAPIAAHAQVVTLDPTQAANISAATGSVPTTAGSFVLSSFQSALPYILLVVGLFTAYKIIMHFVKKG